MTEEDIIRVACQAGWDVQNLDDGFGERLKRFAQALETDLARVGEVGVWGERKWVGLTDQEVMVAAYQAGFDIHEDYENEDDPEAMHWWTPDGEACDDSLLKLRDLIEAKLKEKNQ